ncbi:response regulator transcription factor [Lignipirellula cremea]|uniref:Transcriptional regulatory protein TcrA n=1 Tax=Lignipirellula cremea TaxID=2528010 RepID=A0A518DUC3_9BACT|nr:response regulator [Lignipirellula cremea]QDU95435.1 Transcriptional regulatory protein TcrA [Lignipirellula cremea]
MTQIFSPSTLLLVDDEPHIVSLLSTLIKRSFSDRIRLEVMTDPRQALARIEEGGLDILLTDLQMPLVSGLDLLRAARRRSIATEVIFLTGQSTQEALLEALENGASDYLLKPVNDHQQFVELIEQYHARQNRWRQALGDTWRRRKAPSETAL